MKEKAGLLLFLSLFILLFLTSCSQITNENNFVDVIKVNKVVDLNKSIGLFLDPFQPNSLKIGELLHFQILNQSNKHIRFPGDANIQVFVLEEATRNWKEIQNSVEYQGKGDLIVPKGENGLTDTFIPAKPALENDGKAKTIRVVVSGFIIEDGVDTDKAVSAYIDLTLQP